MIIGITGTLGAGKGTVVEYLVKTRGFKHYSVRDFLFEELKRRGLPLNRDYSTPLANELRAKHGAGYISEQLLDRALKDRSEAVIESIRSVGEGKYLKENGATLWAVDADIKKRYERISKRMSETDRISFEKFVEDEKREWDNVDPSKQNLKAVIAMADEVLLNDGTQKELFEQIEEALKKIV